MPDDRDVHERTLTDAAGAALERDDGGNRGTSPRSSASTSSTATSCSASCAGGSGGQAAEDAFQETFLRALRAYDRLEHGEHLRAWVLTIAARLVIDTGTARAAAHELPELPVEDGRPAYAQIEHLADGLPPTERAAVVLRYAYDLPYDDIALALGSTPEAARQAASSGSPPPHELGGSMTVSPDLDRRFRDAAAAEGLLDVGFDVVDSPIGPLLVAATDRGLARIFFDAEPEQHLERLAQAFGPRVLRSASSVDAAHRQLDEYFDGDRELVRARRRPARRRAVRPAGAGRARPRPLRPDDDLRHARREGRRAPRRARGRDGDEPQPDPDRASVPSRHRLERQPDRLRRRPRREGAAAAARGRSPLVRLESCGGGALKYDPPLDEYPADESRRFPLRWGRGRVQHSFEW